MSETAHSSVVVRHARPSDLNAVESLEDLVFQSDNLSRRSLRYYIATSTAVFLVMERGRDIVGDAIVAFRRGSSLARLYSVAVHPVAAGQGLGRRLLASVEAEARARSASELRLEVRADNDRAIELYRKAGFAEIGRYADYYEDGLEALRFAKPLASSDFPAIA